MLIAVFAALLVARTLGIISVYFFEEDEVAIAVGVAAMVTGTLGDLYRYAVQFGYYRLVEVLDLALGGRVEWIPGIMKALSALAGSVIPVAGYFAFRHQLTGLERWLVVLALAVNPIIWRSSQYGNTAMAASALATSALAVVSAPHGFRARLAALGLFGAGVLMRADTVLLFPILGWLLLERDGNWRRTLGWLAALAAGLAAIYGLAFALDGRMDSPFRSVATHMATPRPTMFWEYLLWAMSPLPMVLALWGMRDLLDSRVRLAASLVIWCLPTLAFYFRATTTSRYFLNAAVPLSIAAAIGMAGFAARLQRWMPARAAWAGAGLAMGIHLFVALGHTKPTEPLEIAYGGTFPTDDGPMPTGALLVRSYLSQGSLARSLPFPRFGRQSYPFWEGVAFNRALEVLADPARPPGNVLVLLDGGFGHAFAYHVLAARPRFTKMPEPGGPIWDRETRFTLGNSRVTTVAFRNGDYRSMRRFEVSEGDQVWALGPRSFPDQDALAKVPEGLLLVPTESFEEHFRTFRVGKRGGAQP